MIQNEHQYKITQTKLREFERELAAIPKNSNLHPRQVIGWTNSYNLTIRKLKKEIEEYEQLNSGQVNAVPIASYESALETHNRGMTQNMVRLFPNAEQRESQLWELVLVKTEYQARRDALEVVHRTQLESLKESCNHYLVGQKAEVRQQVASFLLAKTVELQDSLDRIFNDFIVAMDAKMTAAEKIDQEELRRIRMLQLDRDLENFAILQAELIDRFRRIVSDSFQVIEEAINEGSDQGFGSSKSKGAAQVVNTLVALDVAEGGFVGDEDGEIVAVQVEGSDFVG
jgi:hypothetical protein